MYLPSSLIQRLPVSESAHERALALAQALGVEPDPPLLRSLALASLSHYEFETAQQFGEQLRDCGERESDDVLLAQS